MEKCYVLVLALIAYTGAGAEICDTCLCKPQDTPVSVTCKCKTPETVLDFKSGDFNSKFKNTLNFTISNCKNEVSFKQNSFKELQNLDYFEILDVKQVIFEMGVFQSLNHIKLRKINDLVLNTNAFHGSEMKSVEILQSNIHNLPQFAFHGVNSLEKFVLSDVHIGNVQPNAIVLNKNKAVNINNVTIDKIASNAMVIDATTVIIFKSSLNDISPNAINITAKNEFIISQTKFDENLPDNPIIAKAPVVNASNNIFKRLTSQIIKNFKRHPNGTILFANNIIDKIENQKPLNIPSSSWTLKGNEFKCSCEMLQQFQNLKNSDIVKNNYCLLTSCRVTLSQGEEKCAKQSPANLDDTDLCKDVQTVPLNNSRRGKVHDTTDTTHMPLTQTSKSSVNISVASVFLFWAFLAIILF